MPAMLRARRSQLKGTDGFRLRVYISAVAAGSVDGAALASFRVRDTVATHGIDRALTKLDSGDGCPRVSGGAREGPDQVWQVAVTAALRPGQASPVFGHGMAVALSWTVVAVTPFASGRFRNIGVCGWGIPNAPRKGTKGLYELD